MDIRNKLSKFALALLAVVLLWSMIGFAQEQSNLPYLYQSFQQSDSSPFSFVEPVAVGDQVDVCVEFMDVFGRGHAAYAVTSALGNTYTTGGLVNSGSNYVYHAYSHITNAGNESLTAAIPGIGALDPRFSYTYAVWKGLSGTVDGSIATGTGSTTNTTTVHGDILSSCAPNFQGPLPPTEAVALQDGNPNGANQTQNSMRAGAPGSWTMSTSGGNPASTIAFEPSGVVVGTSAMPDGLIGKQYQAQLTAAGGIAAPTFAVASGALPGCLTLNTSTGLISGTCNTGYAVSIGVTASDGTTTSSTQSLSFKIGTPAQTITVAQTVLSPLGSLGGNPGASLTSVSCGSLIVAGFIGMDQHGVDDWVVPANGVNNTFIDSLGTVFRRIRHPIAGGNQAPIVWYVGQTTASGNDTVVGSNYVGSGLHYYVSEIKGAQNVIDPPAWNTGGFPGSSPITYSVNYTPLVSNMLLLVATNTSSAGDTIAYSPLSVTASAGSITNEAAIGSATASSTSTYTANVSVTTSNVGLSDPITSILGLRPAIASTGCPTTVVHHRTDIQ